MASENIKKRIEKMIKLIDEIIKKCDGRKYEDLYSDENFAEAVCFVLGQIGEQVPGYKISKDGKSIKDDDYDEFFKKCGDVNWHEIKGARNKIYHDYDGLNMDIIWDTIQDLPKLRKKLVKMIT